jgi:hypothetical protein
MQPRTSTASAAPVPASQHEGADKRGYDPARPRRSTAAADRKSEFKLQLMECPLANTLTRVDLDEVDSHLEELRLRISRGNRKRAIGCGQRTVFLMRVDLSQLLTCLHPTPLSLEDMENGFVTLLDSRMIS